MKEHLGWEGIDARENTQQMVDDDEISAEEQGFMMGYTDEYAEA